MTDTTDISDSGEPFTFNFDEHGVQSWLFEGTPNEVERVTKLSADGLTHPDGGGFRCERVETTGGPVLNVQTTGAAGRQLAQLILIALPHERTQLRLRQSDVAAYGEESLAWFLDSILDDLATLRFYRPEDEWPLSRTEQDETHEWLFEFEARLIASLVTANEITREQVAVLARQFEIVHEALPILSRKRLIRLGGRILGRVLDGMLTEGGKMVLVGVAGELGSRFGMGAEFGAAAALAVSQLEANRAETS